jgi:GTP-binding protein HflX
LEEVVEASLLLHVVDASSQYASHQTAHVLKVLAEIGASETRQILVLNKMDQATEPGEESHGIAERILGEVPAPIGSQAIPVSARTGAGFNKLVDAIDRSLSLDPVARAHFRVPASEGSIIHLLHERAKVLASRYEDAWCEIDAEAPESVRRQLTRYVVQ